MCKYALWQENANFLQGLTLTLVDCHCICWSDWKLPSFDFYSTCTINRTRTHCAVHSIVLEYSSTLYCKRNTIVLKYNSSYCTRSSSWEERIEQFFNRLCILLTQPTLHGFFFYRWEFFNNILASQSCGGSNHRQAKLLLFFNIPQEGPAIHRES
jgi:hypothetical protein